MTSDFETFEAWLEHNFSEETMYNKERKIGARASRSYHLEVINKLQTRLDKHILRSAELRKQADAMYEALKKHQCAPISTPRTCYHCKAIKQYEQFIKEGEK